MTALPPPRGLSGGPAGGDGAWVPAPRAEDLVVTAHGARFHGRRFPCEIGRGGFVAAAEKREGDGATPVCVTWLRRLWLPARMAAPGGPVPARRIGPDLGWGDDPGLDAYNGPCALSARRGGAERMLRPDRLYLLAAETGWNAAAPEPGRGSAIFLHVRKGPGRPTAGCAAFRASDLAWILARWTPRSRLFLGRR